MPETTSSHHRTDPADSPTQESLTPPSHDPQSRLPTILLIGALVILFVLCLPGLFSLLTSPSPETSKITGSSALMPAQIGTPANLYNSWSVTVQSVHFSNPNPDSPRIERVYLVVQVSCTNASDQQLFLAPSSFSLFGDDQVNYPPQTNPFEPSGAIQPGGIVYGNLTFEVNLDRSKPPTRHHFTLRFQPLEENPTEISRGLEGPGDIRVSPRYPRSGFFTRPGTGYGSLKTENR